MEKEKSVALFITSCARFDLLEQTLRSFHEKNTYPLSQVVVTEDSPYGDKTQALLDQFDWQCEVTVIKNGERIGQMASIDKGYAAIETEYVFHCEDDWVFTRGGFIEDSIVLLENDPKLFSVWLREKSEFPDDLFGERIDGVGYKVVREICSFNPSLRRLKDNALVAPMVDYVEAVEMGVSKKLEEAGMYSLLLDDSATNHIGWHRRLDSQSQGKSQLLYDLKDKFKAFKAKIYKALGRGHFKKKK